MFDMYKIIDELCKEKKITVTEMCRELKINRSSLSELKQGRAKSLSADKVVKIANFFEVDSGYITGETNQKRNSSEAKITDADIKFALFNGSEGVTDEMYEEVKQFAELVKLREETKRNNK